MQKLAYNILFSFKQGRRQGGDWGNNPPTLYIGHFCKSSKTHEKILDGGMTPPTIFKFQPEFVTSGFQRPDLTYI